MAALSVAMTLIIGFTVLPLFGGSMDGLALLMCIFCPLVIAWPASAWQFLQNERLRTAHAEIAEMHAQLEIMHRELAEAHDALAEKARRDSMTGTLNRESFFAMMERMRRTEANHGALLVIDVDHFKSINDRFGHMAGDDVLRSISDAIGSALRDGDLLGRIGGEEFAAFLPESCAHEAHRIAEHVRATVAALSIEVESGDTISLTVSIGGALDQPDFNLADLFRAADARLYQAKRHGRDRVILDTGLAAAI